MRESKKRKVPPKLPAKRVEAFKKLALRIDDQDQREIKQMASDIFERRK